MSAGGDKMTDTPDLEARLANGPIRYTGVLILGRDRHFQGGERLRLDWRQEHGVANAKQVVCVTYGHSSQTGCSASTSPSWPRRQGPKSKRWTVKILVV